MLSCRTAGGGGFGDPLEWEPARVQSEVLNELITPEKAEEFYGIGITTDENGDAVVDEARTSACRAERRGQKPETQPSCRGTARGGVAHRSSGGRNGPRYLL